MSANPYALLCHKLREQTDAAGAAIIIFAKGDDTSGTGFYMDFPGPEASRAAVVLRMCAKQLETEPGQQLLPGERTMLDVELVKAAVMAEPNLPGKMPDEVWEAVRTSRAACEKFLRGVISMTQMGILLRVESLIPTQLSNENNTEP